MFTVERHHPTVVTVRMEGIKKGWEQWFLLVSDAHHDNLHADRELETRHLKQAKERGAGVLHFGDTFCAMQGKWDKRSNQEQLRPELRGSLYLDNLVNEAAKHYGPYAPNFVLLGKGNHEGSIVERHQTDLIERLAERLRASAGGSQVHTGTYQGWVRFAFTSYTQCRRSANLRYTHGYGGGGPVTKDTIQANRQMVYTDGVDILLSGHTHDSWHVLQEVEGLYQGRPTRRTVDLLKLGTYKEEFDSGTGWAVEKGHPPRPLGAWWLRFYFSPGGDGEIEREIIRTDGATRRARD